ncbi:hypothetical protein GB937_009065 [Aspergillus fischeri]|nr:hypothetical protein GB937_009065 [Aspergillus fischeri]
MQMEELENALSPGYDQGLAYLKAILEGYSNIEPDKVLAHVKDVRDRASAVQSSCSWTSRSFAKHALQMLTPKPGPMIVGRNAAYTERKTPPLPEEYTTKSFHHDLASWNLLWDVVQKETGMRFRMETWE